MLIALVVAGLIICAGLEHSKPGTIDPASHTISNLPGEIASPRSVEHYADQTARVRGYTEYLNAEAERARRYIEANRLKAEAAEIARMLEDDQNNQHDEW